MSCIAMWKVVCLLLVLHLATAFGADTVTANAGSYNTNDPITVTFTTTTQYQEVDIVINGILFGTWINPTNVVVGTVTFTGFVTCMMGPSIATTQLNIVANTTLPGPIVGPSTSIAVPPTYTFLASQCIAYFTIPPTNPAELNAAAENSVTIFTTLAFVDSYVTLNGEFFCNLGATAANSNAQCSGFVPCYLPPTAQLAIVGRVAGDPLVTYSGPTIQLIPNSSCDPTFAALPQTSTLCANAYQPLSIITFTFEINPNDSISLYTAFKIWASNASFPTDVCIVDVAGPLTTIYSAPTTYLIMQWVIPCEFNNVGSTTFTLSYVQEISPTLSMLEVQSVTVTIGLNTQCDLSLILNYPGPCPLPYNVPDCSCVNQSNVTPPCNTCPACPVLAYQGPASFIPGDTLIFYAHNGIIPSIGGPEGIVANYEYYSSPDNFQYAFSLNFFYFSDTTLVTGALGYKPIGVVGNTTTAIPAPAVIYVTISAYPNAGTDYIWAVDGASQLYCGTQASVALETLPGPPGNGFAKLLSVGPTGLWITDTTNQLFYLASIVCNNGFVYLATGIPNIQLLTSSLTGAYYDDGTGLSHVDPALTIVPVPAGGPAVGTVVALSASNIDDSLIAVDNTNAVWLLTGPTGTWSLTTLSYYYVSDYTQTELYPAVHPGGTQQIVRHISYGPTPFFPNVPTYLFVSLAIDSALPSLIIYSTTIISTFDSCNNALLTSWTIPDSYKDAGPVTAVLSYTAAFPDGSTATYTSSVAFNIGPTPLDVLSPRNFCPHTSTTATTTPVLYTPCSSCR